MSADVGSRLVYVIGAESNPVKIGIADRIKVRLSQLQIGCPDKLHVHHVVKVPFVLAEEIEAAAHRELSEHHRRGEWFNVDKAKAAEVVDRLKAAMLAEFQWATRVGSWDLITRLRTAYELRNDVRAAVWDYRDRMEAGESYPAHANGYILKNAGMAAYATFSLVIAQRKPIYGMTLRPSERTKAEAALVKAMNCLAEFRAKFTRESIHQAHRRERAALLAPPSLRPPSLPPVRAA